MHGLRSLNCATDPFIVSALSYFSWVTWIRPNDPGLSILFLVDCQLISPSIIVIAQLFGYVHGLGMSMITFDWNQIAYVSRAIYYFHERSIDFFTDMSILL